MTTSVGIDPGASGAICVLNGYSDDPVELFKLSDATQVDILTFLEDNVGFPASTNKSFAILERVSAGGSRTGGKVGMGAQSAFKFGASFGELRMALVACRIPFELETPGLWQRQMKCLSKGDKNVTKARAQELFPDVAVFHWNADALLLAEYARRRVVELGRC